MNDLEIGQQLGETGFAELVASFYSKVKNDTLLAPMYPDQDWDGAEGRLRDFLVYRFGISDRYIQQRGHPRLRGRHAPFAIGEPERDRWIQLMSEAIDETNVQEDAAAAIRPFFEQVADFMRNQ